MLYILMSASQLYIYTVAKRLSVSPLVLGHVFALTRIFGIF